jgi:hypothetical protein
VVISGCAAAVLVSPFLYYLIRELTPNPSVNWFDVTKVFSADPLNYIIPTPVTGIGHAWFASLAAKFNMQNYSESGAYIGLPLLVIVGWFFGTSCMNRGWCHRPGSGGQSPPRASIASAIAA